MQSFRLTVGRDIQFASQGFRTEIVLLDGAFLASCAEMQPHQIAMGGFVYRIQRE
jgi:hypothetical protein